jgi:5-methyltetrahydropteroyltriglutamate--homocysteine methyltransferase
MTIPTEPIGSLPRPLELQKALAGYATGQVSASELDQLYDHAVQDTVERFNETGSQLITDGEQTKSSFATYPLAGLKNLAPDGVVIPFKDGHQRQLPRLTRGPFRYAEYAGSYLSRAQKYTKQPLKQAVISASAISLIYPAEGIEDYPREQFLNDLVEEAVRDIRSCFDNGAETVQIDFTEGRLAVKLDPSKGLLRDFITLNNRVLSHFSPEERRRIGVHVCPGGDQDSTHSADVPYQELIPDLMKLDVGSFYVQMASEGDPEQALSEFAKHLKPHQKLFVGVTDVINPKVESALEVRDRVLAAAKIIPVEQLGTTDDCGFSPFGDDVSTSREIAFAKIAARVEGTRLAAEALGL